MTTPSRRGSPRRRRALQAFALTALWLLAACQQPAAQPPAPVAPVVDAAHVVAPDGDDDGPGTAVAPYATIGHGLAALEPGETLYVRGGTYRERVSDVQLRPGRPDAPIRVRAYPGERPVLQGVLWLRRPSHWHFSGLNVTWDAERNAADEHMVKLIGGVGWSFADAEVWGARSFAAILVATRDDTRGEPADWSLRSLCVHDTYPTNGRNEDQLIYVNTGLDAGDGVIERNLLFNARNGMAVKLGGPSPDEGGATNVRVAYNTAHDTAQSILVAWRSSNNRIEGNLLGKVGENYGVVRGYELTGSGNVVEDNLGYEASTFFLVDEGFGSLRDGGGNTVTRDPQYDRTADCSGFHPRDETAARYGRYAPEQG